VGTESLTEIGGGRRWDGLLVLCAANNFDGIKLHDQHMAERLATLRPVLYVDPPLSPLTARRSPVAAKSLAAPRLRMQAPGLARLTPVVTPFPSRPGLAKLATFIARRLVKRAAVRLGGSVTALISAWPMHPVFGSCGERLKVYWAQDDFVGGAALLGLNAAQLDAGERQSVRAADIIIASNPVVAETWQSRGYKPYLIPFGADTAAYASVDAAARPEDVKLPPPIAGFIGHINSRIDFPLLEAIAARGLSLLLVGPRNPAFEPERWAKLLAQPNVQWVGPKPFESLSGYLRVIDVGLVPYGDSAFNRGSFPLKTLEYLAAGRPVVSTSLPATRWLNTNLIAIADAPDAYANAVGFWARQPLQASDIAARQAFARDHDWAARARAMVQVIDDAIRSKSSPK
jgi:glycosyltransferase involved in cell wall biosynthesis